MGKKVTCWVCGKEHDYCPTCGRTHGWKYVADTHEHYQIYMVMNEFQTGVLTKADAAEILARFEITPEANLSWMIPAVEKVVRDIIGNGEKKTIKTTKKSKLFE